MMACRHVFIMAGCTQNYFRLLTGVIMYCFYGKLFNIKMLQAKSKFQTDVLEKLLHGDDMTENANTKLREEQLFRNWFLG